MAKFEKKEQNPEVQEQEKVNKPVKKSIYITFSKYRLIKEKDGKLRRDDKPLKTCKMLQVQANELNLHKNNTHIEYVEE